MNWAELVHNLMPTINFFEALTRSPQSKTVRDVCVAPRPLKAIFIIFYYCTFAVKINAVRC